MAINFKAGGELTINDISDSKQLTSLISSLLQRQVIFDPNDKTYSPNYANNNNILVPQLFITGNMEDIISSAKSVKWFYQVNSIGNKIPITGDTADYTLNATTKQLTIKRNILQSNISINYIAEIIYTDPDTGMDIKNISQIEILKITNGVNGIDGDNPIVAVLSNDSHTIPSNSDGLEMNFSGANSEMKVYDGVTDVTSDWVITVGVSSGVSGSLAGSIYTVTNMTSESGYVDFIATKNITVLTKRFTLTKVRRGVTGSNAQLLYLSSTAEAMTFNSTGTPVPASQTISLTTKLQNVTGTPIFVASPYNETGTKLTDITLGGTGVTRTLTQAQWLNTFARIVVTATLGSLSDTITIVKLTSGSKGADGLDGLDGADGLAGKDGTSSYTHIAYANSADGTIGFSNSDGLNKTHVGMYVDGVLADSNIPSKYKWTLVKGADGTQGIAGTKGADGLTPYFHVAYATNSTGTSGFSLTVSEGKTYIGQYTDYTSPDSSDPSKYKWTLFKGSDGINAIVGYLTNESATLGASLTGVVGDFSGASGTFKVFDGLEEKTGTPVVYAKVSNTGCTATIGTNGNYSISAMTTDSANAIFSATYKSVVVTKTLTLSKSKTGLSGEDATAYWLTNSVGVIKKNDAGIYIPATITINALSQKGINAPSAYAGRFIISETTNGTSWVDKYTSTANESTKVYTPSAGITSLRVRMYMAGGVTALVDEQNIPVVIDGSDPIVVILSTPLGSIIKNSTGSLTIEANLYKGGTVITPTSYKWYELDTSVTGGWRQLTASSPDGTTGYTTKTLTVTPASITSLSTYKVEIVYNGLTYSDMTTLVDLSDPISVIIIGSGVYKNGQGTNTYTARLYRNGAEIDVGGTIYLYKWNLLNKDGTLNTSFTATGKTINIPATAFDDTAQLKCDVDDRK